MTENIQYSVLRHIGKVELRKYPEIVLAMVRDHDDNDAFGILFNYISGNNRSRRKIPMTAPVVSEPVGEKVPMTVPVISDSGRFSFVLPAEYTAETAPRPLDDRVELVSIPPRDLAVLTFSGRTTEKNVSKRVAELLEFLNMSGVESRGEPLLMRYNSPFVPGFLRRNEVAVEIGIQE